MLRSRVFVLFSVAMKASERNAHQRNQIWNRTDSSTSVSQSQQATILLACSYVSQPSRVRPSHQCRHQRRASDISQCDTLYSVCAYIIKINKIFDVFIQELKHVSLVGFRSHFNHQKRLDENETRGLDDDAVTYPTSHTYTCERARGEWYADRIRRIRQKKRRRKITSLSDRILTRCDDDDSPSAAYWGGLRTFAMERRKIVGGVKNTAYAKNK